MENTGSTKPQEQTQDERQQKGQQADNGNQQNDLSKKDVPDSTNESTGVPGSGQRQDSN